MKDKANITLPSDERIDAALKSMFLEQPDLPKDLRLIRFSENPEYEIGSVMYYLKNNTKI